jgi:hypothetical protein
VEPEKVDKSRVIHRRSRATIIYDMQRDKLENN